MKIAIICLAGALASVALPSWAGEVYGGLYIHDGSFVRALGAEDKLYETGQDFELGWRSDKLESLGWLAHPSVYVQTQLNNSGNTNQVSTGFTWKTTPFDSETRVYLRPGFGMAVHDGRLSIPWAGEPGITPEEKARREALALEHKNEFGTRVLWNAQFAVGFDFSERSSIELNWNHISHAFLYKADVDKGETNQGQDNLGIRYNHRF